MKRNEIIAAIAALAKGQGFYGRVLDQLLGWREFNPALYDKVMKDLESRNFGDVLDLIMFMEA